MGTTRYLVVNAEHSRLHAGASDSWGDMAMSVTVVLRRIAKPGRETELVGMMVESLQPRYRNRGQGGIFQSDHDPAVALYVAEWDTLAAYEARLQRAAPAIEDLCTAVERHFYEPIHRFERMPVRGPLLTCTTFAVPAPALETVLAHLLSVNRPRIHELSGCVLSMLYRDLDAPGRLFALHRWHTEADRAAFDALRGSLGAPLRDWGVRIERFRGCVRAETDALLPSAARASPCA
jgi:hypothetical protein